MRWLEPRESMSMKKKKSPVVVAHMASGTDMTWSLWQSHGHNKHERDKGVRAWRAGVVA